jgi:hypothetical protein
MQWKKDRDLLVAQTMAFVQSVAGKKLDAGRAAPTPAVAVSLESMEAGAVETAEPLREAPIEISVSGPVIAGDFRAEMQARVANFRAHQARFNREREAYCNATLAKARAAIQNAAAPSRD